jgi:hypothetical protein
MAKASLPLVDALRRTARKLSQSSDYQWGHMGSCNCGFLAQEITRLNKAEIHRRAMERYGDWNEQLNDYCPTSGLPLDDVISEMIAFGFDADDLKHLERLSDPNILRTFPLEERNLKQNSKADVIRYLNAWANLLEQHLVNSIALPELELPAKAEV